MKRTLSLILSAIMILAAIPFSVSASVEWTTNNDFKYIVNSNAGTVEILEYIGSDSILKIPSEIDGFPVTSIGYYAFYNDQIITEVTVPDSVTHIDEAAFCFCEQLEVINLPDTILSMGSSPFSNTSYSRNESNWTDGLLYLGDYLVDSKYDAELGEVTVRDGTKIIAGGTFAECRGLTSVSIPNDTIFIGKNAFSGCNNLSEIYVDDNNPNYYSKDNCIINKKDKILVQGCNNSTIPDNEGITSIGESAFGGFLEITSVNIPEGITDIGEGAFRGCANLVNIDLPEGVVSIGEEAFAYCKSLYLIDLPDSLEHLDYSVFRGCSNLRKINIPDGVTVLRSRLLTYCDNLRYIFIPESVTTIEDGFYDNGGSPIIYAGTAEQWKAIEKPSYVDSMLKRCLGDSVAEAEGDYSNFEYVTNPQLGTAEITKYNGTATDITIPSEVDGYKVTGIGITAFANNGYINTVSIPDSVTNIGASAFFSCYNLETVMLPTGIISIEDGVFSDCISLKNVNLPEGLAYIDDYAFYKCFSLEKADLPDSLKSFGYMSFLECLSLEKIDVPDGVYSLGRDTFRDCVRLQSISLSNRITTIDSFVFSGCKSLKNIDLPQSIVTIGTGAFMESGLHEIIIPDSVKNVYNNVFQECTELETVIMSSNVTTIYEKTFYKNSKLKNINLPEGVNAIGNAAFALCSSLDSINIPCSVKSIGIEAFYGCKALTEINMVDGIEEMGSKAFGYCDSLREITLPITLKSVAGSFAVGCEALESVVYNGVDRQFANVCPNVNYFEDVLQFAYMVGDSDGDGKVSMLDLFNLKLFITQKNQPDVENPLVAMADVNEDGKINMLDSFELKYRITEGKWLK